MEELKIVATITAKAEYLEDIKKALYAVTDGTRKEEGNTSYDLHEDVADKSKFIIIEVWKSQDAIDSHNQTPHFLAFKEAIGGKIENLEINVMKKVY